MKFQHTLLPPNSILMKEKKYLTMDAAFLKGQIRKRNQNTTQNFFIPNKIIASLLKMINIEIWD